MEQSVQECVCVFRSLTLQHPGCLFLYHLPENHPYLFLLHGHHHHCRPAKQRSYPPQGGPKKRRADSRQIYHFFIIIVLKHIKKKKCSMLHTVMPSFDFRASSITVVMAVRWGVRQSGFTVDTAEYRLYLKEETQKSGKVSQKRLKLIFANT